jgi:hypothetical protein
MESLIEFQRLQIEALQKENAEIKALLAEMAKDIEIVLTQENN